jgi:hypothetical protein
MTINPSDHVNPSSNPVVPSAKSGQGGDNFELVLRKSVEKSRQTPMGSRTAIHSLRGPSPVLDIPSADEAVQFATADGLLNALEKYQQLLGDPSADLRAVQPAVDQMKAAAGGAEELINAMPAGHPLHAVMQETMTHISQEIERFDSGYYIDRQ